jgi:hypothetical protein
MNIKSMSSLDSQIKALALQRYNFALNFMSASILTSQLLLIVEDHIINRRLIIDLMQPKKSIFWRPGRRREIFFPKF